MLRGAGLREIVWQMQGDGMLKSICAMVMCTVLAIGSGSASAQFSWFSKPQPKNVDEYIEQMKGDLIKPTVSKVGSIIIVRYEFPASIIAPGLLLPDSCSKFVKIGKWMQEVKETLDFTLRLVPMIAMTDVYGKESKEDAYAISLDASELKKFDYAKVYPCQVLNVGRVEMVHSAVRDLVDEFCKKHSEASHFCTRARSTMRR